MLDHGTLSEIKEVFDKVCEVGGKLSFLPYFQGLSDEEFRLAISQLVNVEAKFDQVKSNFNWTVSIENPDYEDYSFCAGIGESPREALQEFLKKWPVKFDKLKLETVRAVHDDNPFDV